MATGFKTPGSGRKKGSRNKTTLERAEAMKAVAREQGHKLGVEVMRDVMNRFLSMAAKYQPVVDKLPNPLHDEKKYLHCLDKAAGYGDKLAPYESPRLATTTLRTDAPPQDGKPIRVELKLV